MKTNNPVIMLSPEPHHTMISRVTGGFLHPGGPEPTKYALSRAAPCRGARVLDVGCGFGAGLDLLKGHGCIPCGTDISPANLAQARRKNPAARLFRSDAVSLPLKHRCMDGILCECVLSLLEHPDNALKEFHRVLKPGGFLLLGDVYARAHALKMSTANTGNCCLNGLQSSDELAKSLACAGFLLEWWEDRSEALLHLAGQLIFDCGSMRDFWAAVLPPEHVDAACTASALLKPGYILVMARKDG